MPEAAFSPNNDEEFGELLMTMSPILWGAGLACALGGAVAGTALGSTPVLERSIYGDAYQSHGRSALQSDDRATPDHYPLVTPQGTVAVEQLSDRGLFSQARYRAAYGSDETTPTDIKQVAYDPAEDGARWAARNEAAIVSEAPPVAEPVPAEEQTTPLALSAGPETLTAVGQAKTLNVQAVLAMR